MFTCGRRLLVVASVVGLLACMAVAAFATPALGYGKANWQATLNGTFVQPGGGGSEGFWGWCDFAGSTDSGATGNNADCQLTEYYRNPATNTNWTCHLSIDGTNWTSQGPGDFSPTSFHMDGSLIVNGQHLTQAEQDACVGFFYTGDPNSPSSARSFTNVDTFIPGAPGHYNLGFLVPLFFPGDVGEFNFTVTQIGG